MADSDLAITASQVLASANAITVLGTAGATVTAGQAVYLDATTKTYTLADADADTLALAAAVGLALHAASAGQPLRVQTSGTLTLGAAAGPLVGRQYVLSDTAGGLCLWDDVVASWYVTIMGIGGEDDTLLLSVFASGQVYL